MGWSMVVHGPGPWSMDPGPCFVYVLGLIPHDVGGSGDCFLKSVSHQLYGNADWHVEIRMAGISHLHNLPELYIEIISDDSWENYIRQMSLPGTWCDHLIIVTKVSLRQSLSELHCN